MIPALWDFKLCVRLITKYYQVRADLVDSAGGTDRGRSRGVKRGVTHLMFTHIL